LGDAVEVPAKVITAGGQGYDFEEFSASTLQPDGTVYSGNVVGCPEAVAIPNENGGIVAVGESGDTESVRSPTTSTFTPSEVSNVFCSGRPCMDRNAIAASVQ
jgi:hypothetical protein